MEKIVEKSERSLAGEEQHTCDLCERVATISCTDAEHTTMELDGEVSEIWTESTPRYGCKLHPVEPMVRFADGTEITAKEYENRGSGSA